MPATGSFRWTSCAGRRAAILPRCSARPRSRTTGKCGFSASAASAEADVADLSPQARALLQAYANGVNAWLTRRGRLAAPEYILLGKPQPWTVLDSLLWGKTMGLWLSGNWETELERLALSARLPKAKIDQLWPGASPATPAADEAAEAPFPPGAVRTAQQALTWVRHFPQPFTEPAQASNEWAVSGAHSETGQPLLAGDPHLAFDFPGLWYLARIDTPEGMLAGATVPGLPFILIGHNDHVAWTFTTTGADTQDIFIEHVTARRATLSHAERAAEPFGQRREVIHVRGQPDVVLTVRSTRHGPVIGDGPAPHTVLAVEMGNLAPHDTDADGLIMLNQARWVSDVGLAASEDHEPGAEPDGGRYCRQYRLLHHGARADPPRGRRRLAGGRRGWQARLDRLGRRAMPCPIASTRLRRARERQ